MRICFVWTESFKNLQNFGISLSNDFTYTYDHNRRLVTRTAKHPLPKLLFGENISDITGLLGINGSGKSNTLELICLALKANTLNGHHLIVFETEEGLCYINATGTEISLTFPATQKPDNDSLRNLDVIYFSNVFDKNFLDLRGVLDISLNNKNNPRTMAKSHRGVDMEFIDEFNFINSPEFSKIQLIPPTALEIKINRLSHKQLPQYSPSTIARKMTDYVVRTKQLHKPVRDLELVVLTVKSSFLISLALATTDDSLFSRFLDERLTTILAEWDSIDQLITDVKNYTNKNDNVVPWNNRFMLGDILSLLLHLETFFLEKDFALDKSIKGEKHIFSLRFDSHSTSAYELIACILQPIRYSSIAWLGISSGERAYLNLFSSIWKCLNKRVTPKPSNDSTLICIDEGDLYLHPRWQVEFIDRLITSLPRLSQGNIQIVITTHSPILVSDLPHQCIVSLHSRCTSDASQHEDVPRQVQSFGANLYDIYGQSFGLGRKRSGNISTRYINKIVSILDKDDALLEDLEELRTALTTIDDELIQHFIKKRLGRHD